MRGGCLPVVPHVKDERVALDKTIRGQFVQTLWLPDRLEFALSADDSEGGGKCPKQNSAIPNSLMPSNS
ncbi:protein of unknown function [Methylocaldum szegediense]|uniref:Uncharacterized protein n=1 Tax=Methylocaldum szegediense TaxID=73780 RepID=A0ABN8XAF7_9GAMM|nr:protein of unknown function [Methylocaldum szegediense]